MRLKHHWSQFSLRTLLLFMLVCGTVFSLIATRMIRARTNRERVAAVTKSVKEIEKLGGTVISKYEKRRPETWLEALFDDPGSPDDPVGVLRVFGVFFHGDSITDSNLEHLKGLPDLEYVHLHNHTRVTDSGLKHLRELKKLEYLGLDDTNINDIGLEYLQGMSSLRRLDLIGNTEVSNAGIEKLQQALPKCRILRKRVPPGFSNTGPDDEAQ